MEEWKEVESRHAEAWSGGTYRDVLLLKRKYNVLHRLQIPTGNPNMTDEVQHAKRIKHTIGLKADLGDGEEEFDLKEGYQQGPPLGQSPSQEQEAPGSRTTAGTSKASGQQMSPCLAGRCLEPKLQEEKDKGIYSESNEEEEEEQEVPVAAVTAVPGASSTIATTTLTTSAFKRSCNKQG